MTAPAPAERVAALLADYLGPHTARSAARTFARAALKVDPERVRPEDVPRLSEALRPMLRTLLGTAICADILGTLAREFP